MDLTPGFRFLLSRLLPYVVRIFLWDFWSFRLNPSTSSPRLSSFVLRNLSQHSSPFTPKTWSEHQPSISTNLQLPPHPASSNRESSRKECWWTINPLLFQLRLDLPLFQISPTHPNPVTSQVSKSGWPTPTPISSSHSPFRTRLAVLTVATQFGKSSYFFGLLMYNPPLGHR